MSPNLRAPRNEIERSSLSYAGVDSPKPAQRRKQGAESTFLLNDPLSNVGWTIRQDDLVCFAPLKETNTFSTYERQVLQVQLNFPPYPLGLEQRLQPRNIVGYQSAAQCKNDMRAL
jgi:hypothetical protein